MDEERIRKILGDTGDQQLVEGVSRDEPDILRDIKRIARRPGGHPGVREVYGLAAKLGDELEKVSRDDPATLREIVQGLRELAHRSGLNPSDRELCGAFGSLGDALEIAVSRGKADKTPVDDETKAKLRSAADTELLYDEFVAGIASGDDLEHLVIRRGIQVLEANNPALFRAHAVACVSAGRCDLAYESFSQVPNPDAKQREVMGFVAYQAGKYGLAVIEFDAMESAEGKVRYPLTAIAHSMSLYHKNNREPGVHAKILEPYLEESAAANTILGALHFNAGDFENAGKYFTKARDLSPKPTMASRLNDWRVKYHTGKQDEVQTSVDSIEVTPGSKWSKEAILRELAKTEMDLPNLKPKGNMYETVLQLLE